MPHFPTLAFSFLFFVHQFNRLFKSHNQLPSFAHNLHTKAIPIVSRRCNTTQGKGKPLKLLRDGGALMQSRPNSSCP
ncbi:hypothetical protein I3843_05G167900 [Carya illinoinensis]|nr:hypothetical protein I3843_05G167900 [Carya illinoinensis]KAG7980166.1 hypothetical protein I3843_05G167900 [Carya illinoinensis]